MEDNLRKNFELNDLELDAVNGGKKDYQEMLYNNVLTGITGARTVELARKYFNDYEKFLSDAQRIELKKGFLEKWHTEP